MDAMTTASVLPPPPPTPAGRDDSATDTAATLPLPPSAPVATAPSRVRIATPGRIAGAAAQLAALGLVGPIVFSALFGMLGGETRHHAREDAFRAPMVTSAI